MAGTRKPPSPKKLTQANSDALIGYLKAGVPRAVACRAVGIHRHTLDYWIEQAKLGREPYAAKVDEFLQAEAQGHVQMIQVVVAAGFGALPEKNKRADVRALMWVLEKRWPKLYAQQQTIEHKGSGLNPSVIMLPTEKDDA